jgi:transcriptional regulator with XRE-family HTH domain
MYYQKVGEQTVHSVQDLIKSRVAEVIDALDLTQDEFAAYMGVSKRLVSYWLTGDRTPSRRHMVKMASVVDEGIDWFFQPTTKNTTVDTSAAHQPKAGDAHPSTTEQTLSTFTDIFRDALEKAERLKDTEKALQLTGTKLEEADEIIENLIEFIRRTERSSSFPGNEDEFQTLRERLLNNAEAWGSSVKGVVIAVTAGHGPGGSLRAWADRIKKSLVKKPKSAKRE